MTKIRILASAFTCCPPGLPGFTGGESLLGWQLVTQISRYHEVWVLTQEDDKSSIEEIKQTLSDQIHFCYIRMPLFVKPFLRFQGGHQLYYYLWQIKAYFFARKLNKRHKFHIFHHITYANDWMASFIGALLPIPFIRGPGGGAQRTPRKFEHLYSLKGRIWEKLRSAGQWTFRHDPFFLIGHKRAKAILVCNIEALDALPLAYQNKAHLFPVNGISDEDLDEFTGTNNSNEVFTILSAGKLLEIKGFELGIDAYNLFSKDRPDSRMIIVGDGPEMANLRQRAKELDISGKIIFRGWLTRKALLNEMASADVFLFPGLRDGGGEVVIEAMAMGLPVVCLALGGPAMHVTSETGFKIKASNPSDSIEGISDALEQLYLDPIAKINMGETGRKRVKEEYHWDHAGQRVADIYQAVLNNDSDHPVV